MKKNIVKENINRIKIISSRIPKTINEAMSFEDYDGDDEMMHDDEMMDNNDELMNDKHEEHVDDGGMDIMAFVDDIRKKSLKGMAQLADNPDDERYQLLKKIWQICDKKPEQQTAFNNPNQQMQNGGHQMNDRQMR